MAHSNETPNDANLNGSTFSMHDILQALELIHAPTTKNDVRIQASFYLDRLKSGSDALQHGFVLSQDPNHGALIRHFGLSLIEHTIRHGLHHLSDGQNENLRASVVRLGYSIQPNDPSFIRNKIAELWIELTKRTWGLEWFDVDEHLVRLWSQDIIHKEFVLTVLENLSEDIFVRDDPTAVLRGKDLNSALVEIFTAKANYAGGIKIGSTTHQMRCGDDGWLSKITQLLEECQNQGNLDPVSKTTSLKALASLRSAFSWVMTPSIAHAECLSTICNSLTTSDKDIVIAAADALLILYGRGRMEEIEVQALVHPLCQPESVKILEQVYSRSVVGVDEIGSSKYTISKKISELVSLLSDLVTRFGPSNPDTLNITPFLLFMVAIAEHESLIVSIPAVHSWARLLDIPQWRNFSAVDPCFGPLLEVASRRIIQYDQLPNGAKEPAVLFVNDEIELFPERQGFFLNYRKLCSAVIEFICFGHAHQTLGLILNHVDQIFKTVEAAETGFDPRHYEKGSLVVLQADAQFAIIDAAYRGLDKWQLVQRELALDERDQNALQIKEFLKSRAVDFLTKRNFKDPQIKQRQIKTAVEISNRALRKDTGFAFNVLEHLLSCIIPIQPENITYTEAVGDLHSYAINELRRLTLQHADYFVTFYDQLQDKFNDLISNDMVDEKLQVDLKSALFTIIQRAASVDPTQRQNRLWSFLEPLASAWNNDNATSIVSSYESFTRSQAFDQVGPYMESMHAIRFEDWSSVSSDENGAQIQKMMIDGYSSLPLRETRILLSVSTERLEHDRSMQETICKLWSPLIPAILRSVLQITRYNHKLYDPSQWPNVSLGQQAVIHRILRDRYWQSGISEGSMTEFYMRIKASKTSLEGFASSVRGRIRVNLEQCYSIVHTLGRLGAAFYSLEQVPEMIAEALLLSSTPLSPQHFSVMLQMLPKLIEDCPSRYRQSFLTPILSALLQQIDAKLTNDWQRLDEKKQINQDEDNLGDEMRDDSVLRQTTYKAVNLVSSWLDPLRGHKLGQRNPITNGIHDADEPAPQNMRDFVLSNVRVLEPLIMFCVHSLAYKDTRACYTMIVSIQRLLPAFASEQHLQGQEVASVREFLSNQLLKAAITSLNDGYYADHQQHFAHLIALIWLYYGLPTHIPATESNPAYERPPLTSTPHAVLLSLEGIDEAKVDYAAKKLVQEGLHGKTKRLRAIILVLLDGIRGVRLSELGKIDTRPQASRILEKYKQRESLGMQDAESTTAILDDSVDLNGVADMFGSITG